MNDKARRIDVRPIPGHMDALSSDGAVPPTSVRMAINILAGTRIHGFRRYGYDDPAGFKNQDLHDQMLGTVKDQLYDEPPAGD